MATSLENTVRPLQLPDSTYPQTYETADQSSHPPIQLNWGRGGGGKSFTTSYSYNETFYCKAYTTESTQQSSD